MRKITLIILSAIFIAGSFFYPSACIAAGTVESPFPGRVHAHDQWFRVFVKVGSNPERMIDANWRPVFDYPEKLGSGYTADEASKISPELAHYLKSANMYHKGKDMYILSNQGARDVGLGSSNVQYSEWVRNIPIKTTTNPSSIAPLFGVPISAPPGNWSKNNPRVIYSQPPGTVVWDGQKYHYSISESNIDRAKRGITNLQTDSGAHKAFVNPKVGSVGYGELHMYFPYNTLFVESTPVITSRVVARSKAYGYVHVFNEAPWTTIPFKTKFRVYIQEHGKEPQLAGDIQDLAIGPAKTERVGFEFSVPEGQFKLILTVNMYWDGQWVYEPLATLNMVDGNSPVVAMESEYNRNKIEMSIVSDKPLPSTEENIQPSNLAVTSLQLMDKNGNPVYGNVEVNKSYLVKATFKSTFNRAGKAKIRFYVLREKGWMDLKNEKTVNFSPKGTIEHIWEYTGGTEKVTLIATVSYKWNGAWVEELFDGEEEESTYQDNKMELNTAGTNMPDGPPTPGSFSYPLYYHPVREIQTPVYEKILTERTEPGWVMIEVEPPKARPRLID